jgi:hypothetical protein
LKDKAVFLAQTKANYILSFENRFPDTAGINKSAVRRTPVNQLRHAVHNLNLRVLAGNLWIIDNKLILPGRAPYAQSPALDGKRLPLQGPRDRNQARRCARNQRRMTAHALHRTCRIRGFAPTTDSQSGPPSKQKRGSENQSCCCQII